METTPLSYRKTIETVYRDAALQPASALCCVPQNASYLPGLSIPKIMHEMNYGCGTTIHQQDMASNQTVLYVGVGGGLEALQFAYYTRRPGGVIAVDPVAEMRDTARKNLELAATDNDWFDPSFVDIRDGDALNLPIDDETIDVAAQNCLFNIFKTTDPSACDTTQAGDLEQALAEVNRVLKRGGRLVMSDPIAERPIPKHLQDDEVLRAQCISGCLTYEQYMAKIVEAGFGSIEVRSRRPYRVLDAGRHGLERNLLLESLEIGAYKTPVPSDGPCIFTGRYAVYTGEGESFDDGNGHVLQRDVPMAVCDKTAQTLASLDRQDLTVTPSTWHYAGGGCC